MAKKKQTEWPDPPTLEECSCLIGWPPGTHGWYNEGRAVETLLELCKEFGFGRIPQLAAQMEALWRNPSLQKQFQAENEKRNELLQEYRKEIDEKPNNKTV